MIIAIHDNEQLTYLQIGRVNLPGNEVDDLLFFLLEDEVKVIARPTGNKLVNLLRLDHNQVSGTKSL